jgi:hypothetical protein
MFFAEGLEANLHDLPVGAAAASATIEVLLPIL